MRKFAGLAVLLVVLLMSGGVSEAVLDLPIKTISLAGYLDKPQEIRVDEDGKYAYVISFDASAFGIFDVSDTSNPTHIKSITDARLAYPMGLAVSGRYAYVVTRSDTESTPLPYGSNSLLVIDIADPLNPVIKGVAPNYGGRNIVVDGNYAYIAGFDNNAVFIINISNPDNPTHTATIDDTLINLPWLSRVYTIAKQGRYLYIGSNNSASSEALFAKIDVSDPTTPVFIASSEESILYRPVGLVVKGKYAYVTSINGPSNTNTVIKNDSGNSLTIFDVDNVVNGTLSLTTSIYLGLNMGSGPF